MIKKRHRLLAICLLFSWGTSFMNAADEGGKTAPAPAGTSEVELLRAQVEMLKAALEAQQKQINQLAAATAPAAPAPPPSQPAQPSVEPEAIQIASISRRLPGVTFPSRTPLTILPPLTVAQIPAPVAPVVVQAVGPRIVSATQEHEHAEVRQPKHWYEKYSFKGYTQLRHNRLVQTNDNLICDQCDAATGINNNFIFRRARFVLSGDINDKISIYFQPDFAVTNGDRNFAQLRDLYFDIALDTKKEFRFRVGQSKIPYSFENLQSSQNRIPLDRNDATNSAFPNERDIGAFFYWAPAHIRARFAELTTKGLKGSGDYGVLGVGLYNGQVLNRAEANNDLHYSYRYTYPFKLRNGQFIETSLQAYHGKYTVASRTAATRGTPNFLYNDRRVAATLVIYPQPWGLQAEYNYGTGPEYNTATRTIDQSPLSGGYAMATYMKRFSNGMILTPFYRFTNYSGGKKQELDARHTVVRDHEAGFEFQANSFLEITLQYAKGFRIFEDAARPNWTQTGHQLRLQVQVNY